MLHAVPGEYLNTAVVHDDRKVHCEFSIGNAENLPHPLVKPEALSHHVKLLQGHGKWIICRCIIRHNYFLQ
jgi:hypothetical protein